MKSLSIFTCRLNTLQVSPTQALSNNADFKVLRWSLFTVVISLHTPTKMSKILQNHTQIYIHIYTNTLFILYFLSGIVKSAWTRHGKYVWKGVMILSTMWMTPFSAGISAFTIRTAPFTESNRPVKQRHVIIIVFIMVAAWIPLYHSHTLRLGSHELNFSAKGQLHKWLFLWNSSHTVSSNFFQSDTQVGISKISKLKNVDQYVY